MNDISLKELISNDIDLVRKWRNSREVAAYMYTDDHITKKQQDNWFRKTKEDKSSIYWIIEYDCKKLGLASITGINKTLSSCYWAFYLGNTSVRGAGIGSKVEYKILEYVFDVLKLNKLRCEVFVSNDKVIKMHEGFGFRREAYYREHCIKNDDKLDVVGLAMLRNEWINSKNFLKSKIYGE